jgi:cytidylate kinase
MRESKEEKAKRKLKEQKSKQLERIADDLLRRDDRRQSLKKYNISNKDLFDLF